MKERLKRIYVAGKLNDMAIDYLLNVHKMMKVAEKVRLAGFAPFVPALDLLMGIMFGYEDYENYFAGSQPWLAAADAVLLVPGWETSDGTQREVAHAEVLGIPVFEDLEEMKKALIGHAEIEKKVHPITRQPMDIYKYKLIDVGSDGNKSEKSNSKSTS